MPKFPIDEQGKKVSQTYCECDPMLVSDVIVLASVSVLELKLGYILCFGIGTRIETIETDIFGNDYYFYRAVKKPCRKNSFVQP